MEKAKVCDQMNYRWLGNEQELFQGRRYRMNGA